MAVFVTRDQDLDLELQSGAHLTLILVAVGLAFLLIATAVVLYLFPVWSFVRRTLFSRRQVQNPTGNSKVFQPIMSSTPMGKTVVLPPTAHKQLSYSRPLPQGQIASPPQKSLTPFFNPVRCPRTLPHQLTAASYNWLLTNQSYQHQIPPPPCHNKPGLRPHPPSVGYPIVSPHIAGWMMVADTVVGRHPFAQPLGMRVPTQAEIDLISGHVHIPWAYDEPYFQPTPVKILGPAAAGGTIHPLLQSDRNVPGSGEGRFPPVMCRNGRNGQQRHSPSVAIKDERTPVTHSTYRKENTSGLIAPSSGHKHRHRFESSSRA